MRLSAQRLAVLQAKGRIRGDDKPAKASKHRNQKTEVDGITFDSKKEAGRYQELKLLERAGEITDLRLQVPFEIVPAVTLYGRRVPARHYMADFTYVEGGKLVVEDSKGQRLPMYTIKRQLMKSVHNIEIRET